MFKNPEKKSNSMLEDIGSLLKKRQLLFDPENTEKWIIRESEISGKGVFATRDLKAGEIIFKEAPLIIGSRCVALPAACVVCLRVDVPLTSCSGGCRLPVCGEACSSAHSPECRALAGRLPLRPSELWSPPLYRALAPLRCLLLPEEDRDLFRSLSQSSFSNHLEMQLLKGELCGELEEEDAEFLELSCRVLNSVAFEIELDSGGPAVSWRGLFPLAGMMNHSCCPNTQHYYERPAEGRLVMVVATTGPVLAGQELTTGYCPLMWSTTARRHFLQLTKEFLCTCQRCSDPTEFGTYFSGHACSCGNYVLPMSRAEWACGGCGQRFSAKEVLAAESAMLRRRRPSHPHSYLAIQAKVDLISRIGHTKKPYSDASDGEIIAKEKAIKDVMDINDRLQLGQSRLKITLEEELRATLGELNKRKLRCTDDG